jgi:hypothetical protein
MNILPREQAGQPAYQLLLLAAPRRDLHHTPPRHPLHDHFEHPLVQSLTRLAPGQAVLLLAAHSRHNRPEVHGQMFVLIQRSHEARKVRRRPKRDTVHIAHRRYLLYVGVHRNGIGLGVCAHGHT